MRDCLSVITENLLFEIQNQFHSARHHMHDTMGGTPNRKSADFGRILGQRGRTLLDFNNSASDDSQTCSDGFRERYHF